MFPEPLQIQSPPLSTLLSALTVLYELQQPESPALWLLLGFGQWAAPGQKSEGERQERSAYVSSALTAEMQFDPDYILYSRPRLLVSGPLL